MILSIWNWLDQKKQAFHITMPDLNGLQWKINFTLQSFSTYPSGAASFPNQSLFDIIAIIYIISVKILESMYNNNDLRVFDYLLKIALMIMQHKTRNMC